MIRNLELHGDYLVSVRDETKKFPIKHIANTKVHAVAAIGNPQRFFAMLRAKGFDVIPHIFPDHYLFKKEDLQFGDALSVIMTEKDAVKCHDIADDRFWYIPVDAKLSEEFADGILRKVQSFVRALHSG